MRILTHVSAAVKPRLEPMSLTVAYGTILLVKLIQTSSHIQIR